MSTRHRWADVITAWANGEAIQWRTELCETWRDWLYDDYGCTPHFHRSDIEWRVKPRMCSLNGYEFPAPEREAIDGIDGYYSPDPISEYLYCYHEWRVDSDDMRILRRGRVHLSKDAAIAHARAEILAVGGTLEGEE